MIGAVKIRDASAFDGDALARIYNPYIDATTITFEEQRVDAATMAARVENVRDAGLAWVVAELDGNVAGYAYATTWRTRAAYRFAVETAVYLPSEHYRARLGTALYTALEERLHARGIRCLIGCIALPNEPSVALHEKLGFAKVGHFPAVGWKFGRWIDVGFWQKALPQAGRPVVLEAG